MNDDSSSRLDALLRDPLHGVTLIRLRDRHQSVTVDAGLGWRKGHHPQICKTCHTN